MKISSSDMVQLSNIEGIKISDKKVNSLSKTVKESGKNNFKKEAEEKKSENVSSEQLKKAVEELNKFSVLSPTHLKFEINGGIKDIRVKVMDEEGEVIREIPAEKVFEMLDKLQESTGTIIDYYV